MPDLQLTSPLENIIVPTLIDIEEGLFSMGSASGSDNESPVHDVWLDAFSIAKYPVTNREYACFVESTGRKPPPFCDTPKFGLPDQPVVGMTWHDASAYCEWLSDCTGRTYRLPTEAEREKAARGGLAGRDFPWGNGLPADHRGGRNASLDPVGGEGPNGYGLFDMSAGVHEWCADFFDASYYADSPLHNPSGPQQGRRRVARGGSWRHRVRFARCAARSSVPPQVQYNDFGFRCAASRAC